MVKFFDSYTNRTKKVTLSTPDPEHTRVQQHYKEQLEINNIVRRAMNGGHIPAPTSPPIYGDFTVSRLEDAYKVINEAESAFSRLPSDVRARFNNNPLDIVGFVHDEKNRDEAIKIGLLPKPPPAPSVEDSAE